MPQLTPVAKSFPATLTPRRRVLFSLLCGFIALYFARGAAPVAAAAASGLLTIANFLSLGRLFSGISDLADVLSTLCLIFLILLGFWIMARWLNGHRRPLVMMGLQFRAGWLHEWGLGAALGWGIIAAAVLPLALSGNLHYSFALTPGTLWLFSVNALVLLLATFAEELVYRGYPFQRLIDAMGDIPALIVMSAIFTAFHWHDAYTYSLARILVLLLGSILLSLAYLRTRALWLVWGLHFAWSFSEGVLFGLPVGGFTRFSTILQCDTTGPLWLTGGDFGPEASQIMVFVLLAAIAILIYVTRDLNWTYNAPVIVPGGVPMEVAPPAEHTKMEAAAAPSLIQIQPTPQKPE